MKNKKAFRLHTLSPSPIHLMAILAISLLILFSAQSARASSTALYVLDGAALSQTAGASAASNTIVSAGGVGHIGTPTNPQIYTISGLNGTYDSAQSTMFNLYVDANTGVGAGLQAQVQYDLTGDGTWDRTETYNYFATDPVAGSELYTQAKGLQSSSGTFANLSNGKVRIQVWNAIGNVSTLLRVSASAAQGQQSTITIPFALGASPTNTPSGPTATKTNTPISPTATKTNTPGGPTPTNTLTPTAVPTGGSVVPLFSGSTVLEPATIIDTGTAIITRISDRARDRHARESEFAIYDHYLSFYWEQRTASIEIVDHIAKGGSDIVINVTSLWQLDTPDFRAFFRGINTKAEYWFNVDATQIDPTHYTATVNYNAGAGRAPIIGDRMEIEFSQFLVAPPHGRSNYYGTAMLYIVGQGGFVPWEEQGAQLDSFPLPQSAWQGGRTTLPYQYSNEPLHRFKQMAQNMAPTNGQPFMLGRRLFHTDFSTGAHTELPDENPIFTEQVGKLGPRFYMSTCIGCHVNDGRGLPPAVGTTLTNMVTKVGTASGAADPNLGGSLQPLNNGGASEGSVRISSWTTTNGTYGDGTSYQLQKPTYAFTGPVPSNYSVRNTPQLVGIGLLEAVSESTIAGLADPNDSNGDGISGRMQTVVDPQTGQTRMGRFGWKAGKATLAQQIASALTNDMGVTNAIFSNPDCGSAQTGCGASGTELNNTDLNNLTRYIALLGVGARRNLNDAAAIRGETLFNSAKCSACHTPTLTTSAFDPYAELRSQTIHPYTDLLLHDMGSGLADNLPEGIASGSEWRTAPLWSIGFTAGVSGGQAYLHDGRARTLAEAILWHSGEAEAAKEAFRTMNSSDRAALIAFLTSQ